MSGRSHRGKLSLMLLFVGIFAFWWGISVLAQNNMPIGGNTQNTSTSIDAQTPLEVAYAPQGNAGPVAVKISQSGTMYTYSGSLTLASSCDELGTGVAVSGSGKTHVTILLALMKPVVACAEAAGNTNEQPFSVSLAVKSGAKPTLDGLTINGVIVPIDITDSTAQ